MIANACRVTLRRALSLTLLAAMPAAHAQTGGSAATAFDRGWHIVRPGENLHLITAKYVGDSGLWRENWRLNPEIEDPNALTPGQRIKVLIERQRSVPTARLRSVAGPVDEKPVPIPWNEAREQDILLEEDGLRTGSKGSTEMEFQDGTRVLMTEDSTVYLRRRGRRLTGVPPRSVEIVEGQAEVASRQAPGSSAEVEIVVGETRATSRVDESGVAQTRARRAQAGGAKLMVYEGGSEVEAGGETVQVARGMGTSVEQGRPPAPPEPLLPAPDGLRPEAGARLAFNNVEFGWEQVAGAVSYTMELCRDPDCARLVDRATGLTRAAWEAPALARGEYFWRVTAVSRSGLDGYPSPGSDLAILADGPDRTGPTGSLLVAGPQISLDGRLYVDEGVQVVPQLDDSQSGVAGWRPMVDGREVSRQAWDGPWQDGGYRAHVVAEDRSGNESEIAAVEFVVDASAPVVAARGLGYRAGEGSAVPRRLRRRWLRRGRRWIEASVDGRVWYPLAGADSSLHRDLARLRWARPDVPRYLEVRSDSPQVLVRAADGGELRLPEGDGGTARVARIWAADAGAGVDRLVVRVRETETGGLRLETKASDLFGHRRTLAWEPVP